MPALTSIASGFALGAAVALVSQQLTLFAGKDKFWYDNYHQYYTFPEEYTDLIDELLGDEKYSVVGPKHVVSSRKKIPAVGIHHYFIDEEHHRLYNPINRLWMLYLEKIKDDSNNERVVFYYRVSISPMWWGQQSLLEFEYRLLKPQNDTIRVISIDTSSMQPRLMWLTKICKPPKQNQLDSLGFIFDHWDQISNDHNTKVILSGRRGLGKSYTAQLLKKKIDEEYKNSHVRLYDDFDPSSIGVNIKDLALRYASSSSPIIIVINEIDVVYHKVINEDPGFDPREQHTRSKQSFNNMLDAIGGTPYVITIFTTEKDPSEIYQTDEYRSFMREGRVDLFIKMEDDQSSVLNKNDWEA